MRLISSVVLVVYFFSVAFSTPVQSDSKIEQGEALTTSAPSTVIPEESEWGKGFLPPLIKSETSTNSKTSNTTQEQIVSDKGAASPSQLNKGFLPPLPNSAALTSSVTSNVASGEPDKVKGEGSSTKTAESDLKKGFLPPQPNSAALTTSATSNTQKTNKEMEEKHTSLKTPELKQEKGFLPPLAKSESSTTSASSTTVPGESPNHLRVNSTSTELGTNSTAEENSTRTNEKSAHPLHHKKHHQPHKAAKPTPMPVPVTVTPLTDHPTRHHACHCGEGVCACCTGAILESLHIPVHRRACANIEYEPDDFAFRFRIFWNEKLVFNERMSAKNPRPACIPINQYFGVNLCAKLSNVYLIERNMHACLDIEGTWNDDVAFNYPFNCFRIGTKGLAALQPEQGGGLPPPPDEEEQVDEDYDDSARGWTSGVDVINV